MAADLRGGLFGNAIVVINPQSGRVIDRFKTGRRPYRILFHPDGAVVFCLELGRCVGLSIQDCSGEEIGRVRLGLHTTDMVLSSYQPTPEEGQAAPAGKYRLFVAAANTNEVYVVSIGDNKTMNLAETSQVSPAPLSPLGMTPSALALSADQKRLFVACSDADVVASVDVSAIRGVVEGFLPAGAYPAALRVSGDRDSVANARATRLKRSAMRFAPIADPPEPEIAPAEHVIYVIRDNQPEALMRAIAGSRAGFHREAWPAAPSTR